MGHPKLRKKTYRKPTHPWQKERIDEERALLTEFGLKNKKEVWRVASLLRKYTKQAKKLITLTTPQAEKEKEQLLTKLTSLGLIEETSKIEDVLSITLKDILNRRLQTIVHKAKLAKSVRQARQLITHNHIVIGEKKMTLPSYLVSEQEQNLINFATDSALFSQDHPERVIEVEKAPALKKETPKDKPKKEDKKEKAKEEKPKDEKKEEPKKKEDKKEVEKKE
ncbi:MAG: 30S ribosomal protein S4 [Nanoarchaeota archaeon]|nr:30S ribosomal protein S4 [Nanoarchaeota archaeon]